MRHVKMLGLVVVAAFGLMAFAGASSASAFTSAHCAENGTIINNCTLDAEATEAASFTTTAGTISCRKTIGKASISGTVTSIETTSIKYEECTFLGFINVAVNMGTCQYNFHINGEVDITPTGCGPITFSGGGCTVTVGSQNGLKSVTYENMAGPPKDVTIIPNVTNIVYSTSSGCPNGERKNETGGKYTGGKVTVRGTNSKGRFVDFTVV